MKDRVYSFYSKFVLAVSLISTFLAVLLYFLSPQSPFVNFLFISFILSNNVWGFGMRRMFRFYFEGEER